MSLLLALTDTAPVSLTNVGAIASAEAFGVPTIGATVAPAGIATAEAFGTPSLAASVATGSIASAETLGTPSLATGVALGGIASAEAFGVPVVTTTAAEVSDLFGDQDGDDESPHLDMTSEEQELFDLAMALITADILEPA